MTISDLEFFLIDVPRIGRASPSRSLLVRLTTDEGQQGWGETVCRWRPEELSPRRDAVAAALRGHAMHGVEDLLRLDALADADLRSAVEMACWDAIGREAGQPLCHLWGGAFRHHVPLAVRLPEPSSDQAGALPRELVEHGVHSLIVSSSGDRQTDLQALADVRQVASDRAELIFDGQGRWAFDQAAALCEDLESFGLRYLLDPLPRRETAALVDLAERTSVPLALARAIERPSDILRNAAPRAAPYVVVAPSRVGGVQASRRCAAVAEAARLHASLAEPAPGGVAVAAMLHIAASTPNLGSSNECDYHPLQEDVLAEPLELVDGMLTVPQAPGLGVEVDLEKLERRQVA